MKRKISLILILFALAVKPFKISAQVSVQDSLALVDLYDSTNGANWTNHTNWLSNAPVSSWYGVIVVYDGRVSTLYLNNNNLVGKIPYSLGMLGTLSPYFVRLDLSNNQLSGSVPASFQYLTDLSLLNLNNNQLSGDLSNSLASNSFIGYFTWNFSNNNFTYAGLEKMVAQAHLHNDTEVVYAPQANIPIIRQGNTLSVSAGGTPGNNTYKWYQVNPAKLVATITGDSTFTPATEGSYFVTVTNSVATELTLYSDTLNVILQLSKADSLLLVDFYNSTSGANWTHNTNWLTKAPVSTWYGVDIEDGKVDGLYLSLNNLAGTLPASFGGLYINNSLDLNDNNLSGTLPSNMTGAGLVKISDNKFSGPIPPHFGGSEIFEINNNEFTFDGMEAVAQLTVFSSLVYAPQANILLNKHGNILSVSAGGTLANDTFRLYKNAVLNATHIGDSTFSITDAGKYSVTITNAIATQLTLYTDTLTVDSIGIQLCRGSDDTLYSNLTGTSYMWQVNKNDGNGFVTIIDNPAIPGHDLEAIPSSWYGYQYRCIVDGDTSAVYTLTIGDTWTGAVSNAWENPANWSCGNVPDNNTDVIINSGTVVLGSNTSVRSLTVSPGASFTVVSPFNLTVTH